MVDPCEDSGFIDLEFVEIDRETMLSKARSFYEQMDRQRTTRHFSNREVPRELIELAIRTASTAPSGAHLQPWTFVAISGQGVEGGNQGRRRRRKRLGSTRRGYQRNEEVLAPLGTDHVKEHITEAPWVIVLFRHSKRERGDSLLPHTTHKSPVELQLDFSYPRSTTWARRRSPTLLLRWDSFGKYSRDQCTSTRCSLLLSATLPRTPKFPIYRERHWTRYRISEID